MRLGGVGERVRNRLPALLASRDVSIGELARRTFLSPRVLARLRSPQANPALRIAERIATALDLPVEAVFCLASPRRVGRAAPPCRAGLVPLLAARSGSDVWLARAAGLDRAHVNRIKNGRALPSVGTALAIAAALDVDVAAAFPPRDQRRVRRAREPLRGARAQSHCDRRA